MSRRHCVRLVLRKLWRRGIALLRADTPGFYSVEKLHVLRAWRRPTWRAILVLLLVPLPCVSNVVLLDAMPLQDPALGAQANFHFFIRVGVQNFMSIAAMRALQQEVIPALAVSWFKIVADAIAEAMLGSALLLSFSVSNKIFPVPFAQTAMTPLYAGMFAIGSAVLYGDVLRQDPELSRQSRQQQIVMMATAALTTIYSIVGTIYRTTSPIHQLLLSIGLTVLKSVSRNHVLRFCHVFPHDDLAVEALLFGFYIFHALFSTIYLHDAKQSWILWAVIALNAAQDAFAIHHLLSQAIALARAVSRSSASRKRSARTSSGHLQGTPMRVLSSTMTLEASYWRHHTAARGSLQSSTSPNEPRVSAFATTRSPAFPRMAGVLPRAPPAAAARHQNDKQRAWQHELRDDILHHLRHREYVLLRVYIDFIVPFLYLVYLTAITQLQLPSRPYLGSDATLESTEFTECLRRIIIYVTIKALTLIATCMALTLTKQPSGWQQLSFVVITQRWSMQLRLIYVVTAVLSFPLAHFGNDMTFQFKWLRPVDNGQP